MISKFAGRVTTLGLLFLTACHPFKPQTQGYPNSSANSNTGSGSGSNTGSGSTQVTGPFDGTWWLKGVTDTPGVATCNDTTVQISQSDTTISIGSFTVSCQAGTGLASVAASVRTLDISNGKLYFLGNLVGTITDTDLQAAFSQDGATETLKISLQSHPAYTDAISAQGFSSILAAQEMISQPAAGTPPSVTNAAIQLSENQSYHGQLGAHLWIGDALVYAVAQSPRHGTVTVDPSQGTFHYTPSANYTGQDQFGFTASYGSLTSTVGMISVRINPEFTVAASGANLTIVPLSSQVVPAGHTVSYTVTASSGYARSATVGGTCPAGSWSAATYTTGQITADCTVVFQAIPPSLVTPSATNVQVTPSGARTVVSGGTQSFTVTSAPNGYGVSVGGSCPRGTWNDLTYTTGNIFAACSVVFTAVTGNEVAYSPKQGGISHYVVDSKGGLDPMYPSSVPTSENDRTPDLTLHPSGKFAYALNRYTVDMFTIDGATGRLVPTSPATLTTAVFDSNVSLTIDPTGRFAYVLASYSSSASGYDYVAMFTINQTTGVLSPMSPAQVGTVTYPQSFTVDPSGKFAYVLAGNEIAMYTIDSATGKLAPSSPKTVPTGTGPENLVVHPSGKYVYVTNYEDNDISIFDVNQTTGVLSPASPAKVSTGTQPMPMSLHPSGKFAYVVNIADATVSVFSVSPTTGELVPGAPATVSTGDTPASFTFDTTGSYAYVATIKFTVPQRTRVLNYSINATTGALTPLSTASTLIQPTTAAYALLLDLTGNFAYLIGGPISFLLTADAQTGALSQTQALSVPGRFVFKELGRAN